MTQEVALAWFSQYAYQPLWVYGGMIFMMYISSFGFPLPEEVPLIAAGLVAYMARNPELYPPPEGAGAGVDMTTLAAVAFFSVLSSDYLVFRLGALSGRHMGGRAWVSRIVKPEAVEKLRSWTARYGIWACGIFRFTPGLRFPGFMACGALGFRRSTFLLVDGLAALVSVPTQVVLVALYGETILKHFKEFKIVLGCILAVVVVVILYRKWSRVSRKAQAS